MKTAQNNNCPQRISPSLLSAWHDHALGFAESERLRLHVQQCAACQATLDALTSVDTMLRRFGQHPAPVALRNQGSKWRTLRSMIAQQQGEAHMLRIGGILLRWGAAIAAALVVVVVVLVIQARQAQKTVIGPSSAILSAVQAWGANSQISIPVGKVDPSTIPLAGTEPGHQLLGVFIPTDVAPDGSFVVGFTESKNSAGHGTISIDLISNPPGARQQLAQISFSQGNSTSVQHLVVTDGRYIVWYNQGHLIAFDRQSQKIIGSIALSPIPPPVDEAYIIQHGVLYYLDALDSAPPPPLDGSVPVILSAFKSIDLSGFKARTLIPSMSFAPPQPLSSGPYSLARPYPYESNLSYQTLSWPYLLYYQDRDAHYHLYNITAAHDITIANDSVVDLSWPRTLIGTTVYAFAPTWLEQGKVVYEFWRLPHADQPGAHWQTMASLPFNNSDVFFWGINDRLLILDEDKPTSLGVLKQLVAWDTTLGRAISITPFHVQYIAQQGLDQAVPVEQGPWIVWDGVDISGQVTLNLINSATLPK